MSRNDGPPAPGPTTPHAPAAFPVSVKGVVVRGGHVLLCLNERDEWELPGGKLEAGERPEACLVREVGEETGWTVHVGPLLDAWLLHVPTVGRHVFVVTYGCHTDAVDAPVASAEHRGVGLFTASEVAVLPMSDGYRRSIAAWFARLRGAAAAGGAGGHEAAADGGGRVGR